LPDDANRGLTNAPETLIGIGYRRCVFNARAIGVLRDTFAVGAIFPYLKDGACRAF
jgi:hypothetical protein